MAYFKTQLINNSLVNSGGYTQYPVFNVTPILNDGGFLSNSSIIRISLTGFYLISVSCYFTSTVERSNVGLRIGINGVQQPEVSASNYIRGNSNHTESSTNLCAMYSLTANDQISLFFAQLANVGTVNLTTPGSSISIVKVT